jgi:hypothetical protein
VDGCYDWRGDLPAVRQREKVEVVVQDVKRAGRARLESSAHVQALVDLGVERRVFGIASRCHGHKASTGRRVGRSEQGHLNPSRHEPLGEDGNDPLPGSVMPRRNPPGYRREHPHAQPISDVASERRHVRRSRA